MSEPMHITVIRPSLGRVDSETDAETERWETYLEKHVGEGNSLNVVRPTRGVASIEGAYDAALAVPDILRLASEAHEEGADGIVISCMGDPGLHAVREDADIPVVGAAQTSMHVASMLGDRFSVVTIVKEVKPEIQRLAATYHCDQSLRSVRCIETPMLEMEEQRNRAARTIADEAVRATNEDGADTVVLGCTGMLGLADTVADQMTEQGHDLPVIDPTVVSVQFARTLANAGLSHSSHAYATPGEKYRTPIYGESSKPLEPE